MLKKKVMNLMLGQSVTFVKKISLEKALIARACTILTQFGVFWAKILGFLKEYIIFSIPGPVFIICSTMEGYQSRHAQKKSIKNIDLSHFCNFDIGVRFGVK